MRFYRSAHSSEAVHIRLLAVLHPGRVDLRLGRAPGPISRGARNRRNLAADVDQFSRDVVELMSYFLTKETGQVLQAAPRAGEDVEIWTLGSSTFGAQLAAHLGLPHAFASQFALGQMRDAVAIYRERFRVSDRLQKAHVMLGVKRLRRAATISKPASDRYGRANWPTRCHARWSAAHRQCVTACWRSPSRPARANLA
jgi:hypothetical protein